MADIGSAERAARLRAMTLLQKHRYSEKQLGDKLKESGYPQDVIQDALSYVKSFRYVDDLQLAVDYITYHEGDKSKRRLTMDLNKKGISANVISQAFDQWQALGGQQDEQEMIKKLLAKKHYDPECDLKEKQRIYAFLLRKGFSVDNVNSVLRVYEV